MPRNKIISDDELRKLITDYFDTHCGGDGNKLKYPAIAKYVAENGYPSYSVQTLRRNQTIRDYIDNIKAAADNKQYSLLVPFEPLDTTEFLNRHRTRDSLVQALMQRDLYYQRVAESAVHFNGQYKALQKQRDKIEDELVASQHQVRELTKKISQQAARLAALSAENEKLRAVITKYVYPGIARYYLEQDGILPPEGSSVVAPEAICQHTITATRDIKDLLSTENIIAQPKDKTLSGSSVIRGLFQQFEEGSNGEEI